jgi:hypothetical protein
METFITDVRALTIQGIPCKLVLFIYGTTECSISASVAVSSVDITLAVAYQDKAMLIPRNSINDELDRQVALGSAEALLDVDGLIVQARDKLTQLSNLFARGVTV